MRLENFAFVVNRDDIGLDTAIQRVKDSLYIPKQCIYMDSPDVYIFLTRSRVIVSCFLPSKF